tara:strand:- start:330 stop:554 length:225 start_codon:yes stop_codon:yes gene_type:complete
MDTYKIDGNKDLARDPQTNAVVNVNDSDYNQYISVRRAKNQKDKVIDNLEGELNDLKSEMNEIKSLLKELVNGN